MKKLFFPLLFLSQLSFGANWISVYTDDSIFIDSESFTPSEVWIKDKNFKKPIKYLLINYMFDCQNKKIAMRKAISYNKNNQVISSYDSKESLLSFPTPDSMPERHLKAICNWDIVMRRLADDPLKPIPVDEKTIEQFYSSVQRYIPELHSLMGDYRFIEFATQYKDKSGMNGISLIRYAIINRDISLIYQIRKLIDEYNKN